MGKKLCLHSIKDRYDELTAAEKLAADYIILNSEAIVSMPIAEFSEKSGAAKSAIIRCCKSLGFDGYSDLKISLAFELSKNRQLNYVPDIYPDDTASDVLDKVFSANVKALHDTAANIDRTAVQNAVDLIYNAKGIYIYGIGTSSAIVNDFQYRLMQSGFSAFGFTDVPTMKISTLNLSKTDVAIGISHSGRTIATVDALKLARESGAATVCITGFDSSPITKVCDHAIAVYSDEIKYHIEAVSARIAQFSVIDAISIALSVKNFETAIIRSHKTHELVNSIRYK